jgi:hypothetical protein
VDVTGTGGASVAYAQDTAGGVVNPAAPAVRAPYSTSWFEYDLSLGASSPGAFSNTDFDNHGDFANLASPRAGDFIDVNLGGTLQFGNLGVAATGDLEQFSLTTTTTGPSVKAPSLDMEIGRFHVLAAYGLLDGQLVLGAGARIVSLQLHENSSDLLPTLPIQNGTSLLLQHGGTSLLTMTGAAPEVGVQYMPTGAQWRLGAAARAPVNGGIFGSEDVTTNAAGARLAGAFVLPSKVAMPWEVDLGVAYQLGPRPLNPGWENPHEQEAGLRQRIAADRELRALRDGQELVGLSGPARDARAAQLDAEEKTVRALEDQRLDAASEQLHAARRARYENWPRERILLLASVLLTGPTGNAVSVEGFLDQRVETVGRIITATPRFGLEGEPLRDRITLRVGTYVEPSRYDDGSPRQHFTFGGDVRLLPVTFWGLFPDANWKVGVMIDLAPRYTNYGIAIGTWH